MRPILLHTILRHMSYLSLSLSFFFRPPLPRPLLARDRPGSSPVSASLVSTSGTCSTAWKASAPPATLSSSTAPSSSRRRHHHQTTSRLDTPRSTAQRAMAAHPRAGPRHAVSYSSHHFSPTPWYLTAGDGERDRV